LFYSFSRFLCRLAIRLFVKNIRIENLQNAPSDRPLLLASNHSGSFFDAVVLGVYLSQPIHTFTRADVFRKPAIAKWLRRINLIPAYRGTEGGREHLKKNEESFRMVMEMFRKNKCVVIFSEGVAVNEWNLRPLAKGTGRLAWQTWFGENPQLNMEVIPTGLTYEHYEGTNKDVLLKFDAAIRHDTIKENPAEQEKWLRAFNLLLTERMKSTILETPDGKPDVPLLKREVPQRPGDPFSNLIGALGRAIHRPVYRQYKRPIYQKTKGTVFFDSVLFGAMMYTYPLLVGILALLIGTLTSASWGFLFFIAMPVLAWYGNQYR
jgi:1-acyl-sn-glycerol-3-phosphate acyltransferase